MKFNLYKTFYNMPTLVLFVLMLAISLCIYFFGLRATTPRLELRVVVADSAGQTAAAFRAQPSEGAYSVGTAVPIDLVVDASDTNVNAVEATIEFATDTVDVSDLKFADSIVTLWVQEPSVHDGTITFSGGMPTGFNGMRGKILSFVLKPKHAGTANLAITNAQILAADGNGTNVLQSVVPAKLRFFDVTTLDPLDLNADGTVGLSDLGYLFAHMSTSTDLRADLNHDGVVNLKDASIFLSRLVQP